MSARYEHLGRSDSFQDVEDAPDREISLGTTTILAIFVGLALLCGVFFGFGYSMGRRSLTPTLGNVDTHVSAPPPSPAETAQVDTPEPEPAASSPTPKRSAGRSVPATDEHSDASPSPRASTTAESAAKPSHGATARVVVTPPSNTDATAPRAATSPKAPAAAAKTPSASPTTAAPPTAGAAAPGQSYVQIAAISHKEDADLLLASLHRRGYAATIRQTSQDNLLHIQIGPLASKKDAETMRQRLLSDGYNAIVK